MTSKLMLTQTGANAVKPFRATCYGKTAPVGIRTIDPSPEGRPADCILPGPSDLLTKSRMDSGIAAQAFAAMTALAANGSLIDAYDSLSSERPTSE